MSPAADLPPPPSGPGAPVAASFGLRTVDVRALRVPPDVLARVPGELAERHQLLPVACAGGVLRVAVGDPLATEGPDRLAALQPLAVEPLLADPADLREAIHRLYGAAADARPLAPEAAEDGEPAVRWVDGLLRQAVARRASDIHVEPLAARTRVRYRIDGVLQEGPAVPREIEAAVGSRIKILAGLSIDEKRLPQDGRIRFEAAAGRPVDLRVSSVPATHGESLALRLLDRGARRLELDALGLEPDHRRSLERLLARPDGLVLVTGPTGSGKTTTLYSCLAHLNRPDRKIITVEDPVEYQLPGVNQVPVRPEAGLTFAAALRAMLRQSPNVIMVGEIRDRETAEIALQASLTGHFVFSTLHTGDAAGAVARLADLGLRPHLVAGSLRAVVAQRLVRAVCPHCARPAAPSAHERRLVERPAPAAGGGLRRGAGCAACAGTGFRGRIGLFEFLLVDDELRPLVAGNAGAGRLRALARSRGGRSLREDGVRKAAAGLTTLEEVIAATADETA